MQETVVHPCIISEGFIHKKNLGNLLTFLWITAVILAWLDYLIPLD
jgi:hypothetical protein